MRDQLSRLTCETDMLSVAAATAFVVALSGSDEDAGELSGGFVSGN